MVNEVSNRHFIAGLPRSGSTLLSGILRQNPRIHAAMSSPVSPMFRALLPKMSSGSGFSMMFDDALRQTILLGVLDAYYSKIPNGHLIFDTSRAWHQMPALLQNLYPDSKIICCVRDINWILDSVEQILNKNPLQLSGMFGFKTSESVYDRVEQLMEPKKGFVGGCLASFREIWFGEYAGQVIVVPYDNLVKEPQRTMSRLYKALGEESFSHDFLNVDYDEPEYDKKLGMPGLHKVHKKVEYRERMPCLPPDLFAKYAELSFWKRPELNSRGVRII